MNRFLVAFMVCIFAIPLFVLGQEMPSEEEMNAKQAIVLSDTNVYNAVIAAKLKDRMIIDFTLQNDFDKPQGDIHYEVQLHEHISDTESGKIDNRLRSDDVISLNPGQSIEKSVEYIYPLDLNGQYDVWIVAYSSVDGKLGFAKSGTVLLNGVDSGVNIDDDSCFVTIEGIDDKFSPLQGIDIDGQKEKILLTCNIKNSGDTRDVVTQFITTKKTQYSEKIDTDKNNYLFVLEQDKEEKVVFFIPLPLDKAPGAYDVNIMLYNNMKNKLDDTRVHYVIQGESASIHDIHIDKSTYKNGDQMIVDVSWSGPADGYMGSRTEQASTDLSKLELVNMKMHITAVDSNGQKCINDITKILDVEANVSVTPEIIRDCDVPYVSVQIRDENNNVLSEHSIPFNAEMQAETQNVGAGNHNIKEGVDVS